MKVVTTMRNASLDGFSFEESGDRIYSSVAQPLMFGTTRDGTKVRASAYMVVVIP